MFLFLRKLFPLPEMLSPVFFAWQTTSHPLTLCQLGMGPAVSTRESNQQCMR